MPLRQPAYMHMNKRQVLSRDIETFFEKLLSASIALDRASDKIKEASDDIDTLCLEAHSLKQRMEELRKK